MNTLCPQCGWGVKVDEDGCCAMCGATAIGEGVDAAWKARELAEQFWDILREYGLLLPSRWGKDLPDPEIPWDPSRAWRDT